MKGLVAYGSSSEDEDDEPASRSNVATTPGNTQRGPNSSEHQQQNDLAVNTKDQISDVDQRPMVGPSRPSEIPVMDAYDEAPLEQLPLMPEGDLLRYLTQPSHPVSSLPPPAESAADPAITAKFRRFLELKATGIHFNQDLAGKASFKNPSLFATLLEKATLPAEAQYASTLPRHVFEPDGLPSWAFKEELLKQQQQIHAKEESSKKAAAGNRTIDFVAGSNEDHHASTALRHKRKEPG